MSKYALLFSSWRSRNSFSHQSHAGERSCQLHVLLSQTRRLTGFLSPQEMTCEAVREKNLNNNYSNIHLFVKWWWKWFPWAMFYTCCVLSVSTGACFKHFTSAKVCVWCSVKRYFILRDIAFCVGGRFGLCFISSWRGPAEALDIWDSDRYLWANAELCLDVSNAKLSPCFSCCVSNHSLYADIGWVGKQRCFEGHKTCQERYHNLRTRCLSSTLTCVFSYSYCSEWERIAGYIWEECLHFDVSTGICSTYQAFTSRLV